MRGDGDFDNDGINDLAIFCSANGVPDIVIFYLTSKYMVDQSYFWFPWESSNFEYKNNVLTLSSNDGNGRFSHTLKFKYYTELSNMKLIGYGEEYYGDANAQGQGAYSISINLNTNEYEIGGVKRKISLDLITLSNVEKYFDYLSSVGNNYKGK